MIFGVAVIKAAVVAVAMYVAMSVFRLGWFIPWVVLVGAVIVVAITRKPRLASFWNVTRAGLALLVYLLVTWALFFLLTEQVSHRTYAVTWHDYGAANEIGESEIFLEIHGFPGHGVGFFSDDLRMHLASSGTAEASVEFEVLSENGCVLTHRVLSISGFEDQRVFSQRDSYARSGNRPSPWSSRYLWCR